MVLSGHNTVRIFSKTPPGNPIPRHAVQLILTSEVSLHGRSGNPDMVVPDCYTETEIESGLRERLVYEKKAPHIQKRDPDEPRKEDIWELRIIRF